MDDKSILTTIKKMLGVPKDYTPFDVDIIVHINSAFSTLAQLGVGPASGFAISSVYNTWSDFDTAVDGDDALKSMIVTYVYAKTKLLFDPPTVGGVIDAYKNTIKEQEWRLCAYYDR